MDFLSARPCTGNSYVVYPAQIYNLPLEDCGKVFGRKGYQVRGAGLMVDVVIDGSVCTLYRTGRLLINPCSDRETAVQTATRLFSVLEGDRKVGRLLRIGGEGL